ncbi:hypothetical protein B4923_01105 [Brenneria roseae subsp. americana]|uniref:Uncharacterized protein n=1 Tax=Brenneria roseae subsp. americana TaxID=1508507 RepID=A0A2U1U274_9GAMM|nr:hypothetical protein [Brenneria roseae]PWC15744.1 hypothetical protein B4923_01105 [Brenneria roseae subsp. americana]
MNIHNTLLSKVQTLIQQARQQAGQKLLSRTPLLLITGSATGEECASADRRQKGVRYVFNVFPGRARQLAAAQTQKAMIKAENMGHRQSAALTVLTAPMVNMMTYRK